MIFMKHFRIGFSKVGAKHCTEVISIFAFILIVHFFASEALAQEQSSRPHVAQSPDAKAKIKSGAKIAIILTGSDNVLTKLLEDAVGIQASNSGLDVFSREQVEFALAKRLTTKSEQGAENAVGTLDIAKALGADLIVTGSAVVVVSESQPVLVKAASLQVLDGASGKPLVQTLFDSKDGLRLTEVSRAFVELLNLGKK
jgi:hypothetical protein